MAEHQTGGNTTSNDTAAKHARKREPTFWHRALSEGILQSRWPYMSMHDAGFPFLYTIITSIFIYGVALVLFVTDKTNDVHKAFATVVFVLIALVTLYVTTTYMLKLLFIPLNVERDPLTDLFDMLDVWFSIINGLTGIAMVIFIWDPNEYGGGVLASDGAYGVWVKLMFTAIHNFHSAGFGSIQASGYWALMWFIVISYAGRFVMIFGLASLLRLMSRNTGRFRHVYRVNGTINGSNNKANNNNNNNNKAKKPNGINKSGSNMTANDVLVRMPHLRQVSMTRAGQRAMARRGQARGLVSTTL